MFIGGPQTSDVSSILFSVTCVSTARVLAPVVTRCSSDTSMGCARLTSGGGAAPPALSTTGSVFTTPRSRLTTR